MPSYVEFAPPPPLAASVECFWVMRHSDSSSTQHRVLPDGCADIIFSSGSGKSTLQVAGVMTKFQDFPITPAQTLVGMRFHPGMWTAHVGVPGGLLTDTHPTLEELWGSRARTLLSQIENLRSPKQCASLLAEKVTPISSTPLQRALAFMRSCHGLVSLDDVASQASLSPRQFRRQCLSHTGLSPKLLARILRFRYALSRIHNERGEHAGLAADCGYFDQSHFIADFQRFSGHTPASFGR